MLSPQTNIGVLIDAWKLMVGRMPGANIEEEGGVATIFAHVPLPFLNVSVLDRPLTDPDALRAAMALAKQRASACRYGSLLALCGEWAPKDWMAIAEAQGYSLALNMTWMATDRLLRARREPPPLEFRRVIDEATARDLALVNAHAYRMQPDLFECICNMHLWTPAEDSYGFVAYADGRAVSAAAAYAVAGTVYIAFVATVPEGSGKGYAEAVMRHAIGQGSQATKLTRLTLHASDMGRPLYQSMGFEAGGQTALLVATQGAPSH